MIAVSNDAAEFGFEIFFYNQTGLWGQTGVCYRVYACNIIIMLVGLVLVQSIYIFDHLHL